MCCNHTLTDIQADFRRYQAFVQQSQTREAAFRRELRAPAPVTVVLGVVWTPAPLPTRKEVPQPVFA